MSDRRGLPSGRQRPRGLEHRLPVIEFSLCCARFVHHPGPPGSRAQPAPSRPRNQRACANDQTISEFKSALTATVASALPAVAPAGSDRQLRRCGLHPALVPASACSTACTASAARETEIPSRGRSSSCNRDCRWGRPAWPSGVRPALGPLLLVTFGWSYQRGRC